MCKVLRVNSKDLNAAIWKVVGAYLFDELNWNKFVLVLKTSQEILQYDKLWMAMGYF